MSNVVLVVSVCDGAWTPKLTFANPLSVHCICAWAGGASRALVTRMAAAVINVLNVLFITLLALLAQVDDALVVVDGVGVRGARARSW